MAISKLEELKAKALALKNGASLPPVIVTAPEALIKPPVDVLEPAVTEAPPEITPFDLVASRIEQLQQSLNDKIPGYESQLYYIHQSLVKEPDFVHLLTEEQIGIIVTALSQKKGVVVALKAATARGKKKINLDTDI